MPNPIYNQGIDFVTSFVEPSRKDIVYDEFTGAKPPRMDKALEQRGYLEFHYGSPVNSGLLGLTDASTPITKRRLPFFEDPAIKEHGEAKYAENRVLLRNEPVRMYVGTEARKFSLELLYTLPHIMYMLGTSMPNFTRDVVGDIDATRKRMVDIIRGDYGITEGKDTSKIITSTGIPVGTTIPANALGTGPRFPAAENISIPPEDTVANYLYKVASDPESYGQSEIYTYICHLVNIVISSVRSSLSDGEAAGNGPPIALLKYGAVYDHIPCIVKDYRIEYRPDSGQDAASLYPRVVRIKISLEEFRQSSGALHGVGKDFPWGWDTIFRDGKEPRSTLR